MVLALLPLTNSLYFLWYMQLLSRVCHVTFYIDEEMSYIVMFSAQVPSAVYLMFVFPWPICF